MRRARLAGVVVALAVAWCAPSVAHATDVSAEQLQSLAREAADDPGALAELRRVDSVDGQPVDVGGALRGARGDDLDARLAQLEDSVATQPASGAPRRDARDVLAQRRFHEAAVPGPFHGLIERLGNLIPDINLPLDWLDDILPGGRSVVWLVLGALFAGLAWFLSRRVLTRRIAVSAEAAEASTQAIDDPKALDRRAAEAEAAGDLEAALRLRFRAGLLRLDARGAIVFRPSISTYEVRRTLHSQDFDALAATFDDVVYGGREPRSDDVLDARDRWPAVVSAARRHDVAA